MKTLFYLLPVLVGVAITIQAGINSQLRLAIGNPLVASLISFLGGTLVLAIMVLFTKNNWPDPALYSHVHWYKFSGGLLGVFVVFVALFTVKEIGAANMFVLIVAGQLLTALLMDHFGLLGMKGNPVSLQKLLGILLVVVGAFLVNKKL
ncbi:MAG: hypothetical protein RLZZ316_348 [Bacteroidota bacterium]|jgi:bacterial/archaeal transporter family-2 protein